jgi:hypothetical protein
MNRAGSGSRITQEVRDVIYKYWKAEQDEINMHPEKRPNIKKLLDDVNKEVIKNKKRMERISKSQLYVEISAFKNNAEKMQELQPYLDQPFNLGILCREFGNQAVLDSGAIRVILIINRAYQNAAGNFLVIFTNRQALWIARLYYYKIHYIYRSTFDGFDMGPGDEDEALVEIISASRVYTQLEIYNEITGLTPDTSELDKVVFTDKWESVSTTIRDQIYQGSEDYRNYLKYIQQELPKKQKEAQNERHNSH